MTPHPLRLLAGGPVEGRRRVPALLRLRSRRRAAQREDRGLDLIRQGPALLDRLAQRLERQVVALEEALEALGQQSQ